MTKGAKSAFFIAVKCNIQLIIELKFSWLSLSWLRLSGHINSIMTLKLKT